MEPESPRHGESRNHRPKVYEGEKTEYLDATTGEVVYRGPVVTLSTFTDERWCAHCKNWFPGEGIFGILKFEFEHEHGRTVKE